MRFAVVGFGRMGREVAAAAERRGHELTAIVDPTFDGPLAHARIGRTAPGGAEIAFEFTSPTEAERNVIALLRCGVSVVCGSTGWDPTSRRLEDAVRLAKGGLVVAPNFSIGMHLFSMIVSEAARLFGAAGLHDPWVLETHHRGKVDAPSGTARLLARLILTADGRFTSVQEGNPEGPIAPGALHVASVRAGHEPGTHCVGFDGEHDAVTLSHRTRGRSGLALGAVLAAEWLVGRRGRHGFGEVVGDLLHAGTTATRGTRRRPRSGGRR